jgi:acyl-CoA synthetase (AMP-forming)/AMP-acid ligase II
VTLADLDDGSGRTELLVSSDTVMRRRIGLIEGRGADDFRASDHPVPPALPVLATGDVFTQDEEGYLYYRGRLTEYIVREGEKVSLATVRRVATQLPGVLAARIRVDPRGMGQSPAVPGGAPSLTRDDSDDFDLTLTVAEAGPRETPEHYRALLARTLRRGELPGAIHVVVDQPAQSIGYK